MNIKPVLLSIGDLSLSQLLICQVANVYFRSADFKKTHYGITVDLLMAKDPYLKAMNYSKLHFLLESLKKLDVFNSAGQPDNNLNLILGKLGIKGSPALEVKSDAPVSERQEAFQKSVMEYAKEYPLTMLTDFYNYWGPVNAKTQTMRFEDTEYFELGKRLANWASRGGIKKVATEFSVNA